MTSIESDVDAALSIGMDTEFMRINRVIDEMIKDCTLTGHGKAKRIALRELKQRIKEESTNLETAQLPSGAVPEYPAPQPRLLERS